MTCKGHLLSIDRHGINRSDIGPLAKCSFEETSDIIIKAGIFGELDKINGVSANIMLGQIAKCGTGDTEIIFDESQLVNLKSTQEQFDESLDEDTNIDDCDLDFEFTYMENNQDIEQKTHSKLILT
jgi:DNA-directed RNA polymerase II subunit RPB1